MFDTLGGALGDVNPRQLKGMLSDPSKLAGMIDTPVRPGGPSSAAVFADVVNAMRADHAALAEAHDVDVDVELMTSDRAAQLLAGVVQQNWEVLEVFNEEAAVRDRILRQVLDDDEYRAFMSDKLSVMNADEWGEFDDEATEE